MLVGCVFGVLGFAIYGLAQAGHWFLAGIPVMALWGLASPATQAMISREVGPDAQGRLQGSLSSLMSLAGILGPALFTGVFAHFIGAGAALHQPGAPFLLASGLVLVAAVIAWRHTHADPRPNDPQPTKAAQSAVAVESA